MSHAAFLKIPKVLNKLMLACTTKFMTLEEVKKGKAPLKDYSLVVSMNIINKGEASKSKV